MTRRRILITGATGGIGKLLAQRLRGDYDLVLQGRHPDDDDPDDLVLADLTNYDDTLKLMDGVDTVVHMAGSASPDSTWDDVLQANIIGFRNALEAAREAGVRRFVFASSNHAMGMYDRHGEWPVHPHTLPRGDSLYGVSKIFGEALGRFYHDEYGIDFIALRIGWSSPDTHETDLDLLRAMWLSPDDTEQVVRRAIEAETRFGLYYAISDNPNRRWDMTNTMLELGYRPKDSWTDHSDAEENTAQPTPPSWPKG
ncbi:NAD-dependent epimerase/dehydratase family protein [Aestuariimicrobium sp. T2.26MG-19.2B]|uniref:NAD-dependent epimerase/dehydratase family protein n=1 Tax=Aestuariimicrobium sp. T2.26MG-19.2B TaxID=3040679 RepID=UPI0024779A00|nr:NAD(P)-dependent oxidoreductase [Aestuariimicrobium sp. T2.26MG-19.2B]CAI9409130.1 Uronate dehydrogenase [Aestuariimicrobium sp. T2.26MG-19.2B]